MNDEERAERCETCRYVHDCGDEWLCRRFPIYATKEFNDWCGEWKPIGPDLTHGGMDAEIAESQQAIQLEREESHRRWQTIQQLEARIEEIQHEGRRWEE